MPAQKPRSLPPAPPVPSAAPRVAQVPESLAAPTPAAEAKPEAPKAIPKVRVRTRYDYPIWVPHAGRHVFPGETVELDDVHWLRRQIVLGTFVSL